MRRYSIKARILLRLILAIFAISININFNGAGILEYSYAANEQDYLEQLVVKDISINSKDEKSISGTAILRNDSDYFFPELWYATEMYLKVGDESNLINKQTKKFQMAKHE